MEPSPRLQRIDQVPPNLIAVAQPLVLLLENGPRFSVIVSTHVASESDDASTRLEDCTQIRFEEDGRHFVRVFESVVVTYDSDMDLWIASPDNFKTLFSQPSEEAYLVIQMKRAQAVNLGSAIDQRDFNEVFEILRKAFASMPGFYSPSPSELRAPENYATGRGNYPSKRRFI